MLQRKSSAVSYTSIPNSWNRVTSCKHFFPCNSLTSGNILDVKGGVIAQPQSGNTFEYDATLKSVRSTATDVPATAALVSGAWSPLLAGKSALFMTAGYLSDPGLKFLRTSIGLPNLGGWGLSDGYSVSGTEGHVLLSNTTKESGSQISNLPSTSVSLFVAIENELGSSGYFFRYAIYRPDGLIMEAAARNGTTGAIIPFATNSLIYNASDVVGQVSYEAYFRMSGYKSTGIALFYFDAIPSDYMLGMLTMAKAWKDGNRLIWPSWV